MSLEDEGVKDVLRAEVLAAFRTVLRSAAFSPSVPDCAQVCCFLSQRSRLCSDEGEKDVLRAEALAAFRLRSVSLTFFCITLKLSDTKVYAP